MRFPSGADVVIKELYLISFALHFLICGFVVLPAQALFDSILIWPV